MVKGLNPFKPLAILRLWRGFSVYLTFRSSDCNLFTYLPW
nr:MAG TPA: hypothetical protein [Caudoviricetes sp.]DAW86025.1 MAG TPA: hypothetical protein [Caudoviricetes sp.]